jgi:hypothetical protein
VMARNLLVEPEPDFTNLSDFVGHHDKHVDNDSLIISTLSSIDFKVFWSPFLKDNYLGLIIDSVQMTFSIPEEKLERL